MMLMIWLLINENADTFFPEIDIMDFTSLVIFWFDYMYVKINLASPTKKQKKTIDKIFIETVFLISFCHNLVASFCLLTHLLKP